MASFMACVRPGESGMLASARICVHGLDLVHGGRWGFGWGCEPWARAGIDLMILYICRKKPTYYEFTPNVSIFSRRRLLQPATD